MDFISHLLAIAGILLLLLYLWNIRIRKMKGKLPPQLSGALPIIGHLHKLGGPTQLFRTLAAMSDKHGPIFIIRLGKYPALVVSSHDAVKQCFTKNDAVLATRPISSHGKYLGCNFAAFGFSPYGSYWRDMRKFVMVELLSRHRLENLKHVISSEVDAFVKKGLYGLCKKGQNGRNPIPTKVVISDWIDHLTLNVITRMIAGKRYFDGGNGEADDGVEEKFGKIVKEFMSVSGKPVVSDVIGFPSWIDFKGQVKELKRIGRELDSFMGSWVEEHYTRMERDSIMEIDHEDFIDVMLAKIEDNSMLGYNRETIIKATAMNLILAGSETTAITLIWILSLLLNNKHVLKLAQEELDLKVGRHRWVEDADVKNITYLQAIVKETLRLYPPAPLSVPHEATEDCEVSGFRIPKGTRLFVNMWKLHRDPNVWTDPEEFRPERFLTSHEGVDVFGQHFEFIPFGSGRRACPGATLALQVIHLALGRLLQGFEMATELDKPVDLAEGSGITLPKATSLEVVLIPRLSFQLYEE